jgi:hypothetical protein
VYRVQPACLDAVDAKKLEDATAAIIRELEAVPNAVNAEVPRALAHLNQLLRNPTAASNAQHSLFCAVTRHANQILSAVSTFR